jgi:hypothetical protein
MSWFCPAFWWRDYDIYLGGSLVTTAWHVLRLRMEEMPSSFGGQLWIYWISSRGQTTRGGPPAWGLGVGLTLTLKNKLVTKILKKPWTWTDSLDKRPKQKKMDIIIIIILEIWSFLRWLCQSWMWTGSCRAIKKLCKEICDLEPDSLGNANHLGRTFQMSASTRTQHTLTHTDCKVIVLCALEGNNSSELKVHV